jgi:hypothetical protein
MDVAWSDLFFKDLRHCPAQRQKIFDQQTSRALNSRGKRFLLAGN